MPPMNWKKLMKYQKKLQSRISDACEIWFESEYANDIWWKCGLNCGFTNDARRPSIELYWTITDNICFALCIMKNWNALEYRDRFIQHRIRILNCKKSLFIWWLWWWSQHRLYSLYMTNKYFLPDKNNNNENKTWTLNVKSATKTWTWSMENRRQARKIFMWSVFPSNNTATTTTTATKLEKKRNRTLRTALCVPCAALYEMINSNFLRILNSSIVLFHLTFYFHVFFSFEIRFNVCRCAFWAFLLK